MTLTILPECSICQGWKYYRELDPDGKGQLERCPECNPEPLKQNPDLVTVRRSDLFAMLENAIPHALTAWLQGRIDKMEKDAK